MSSAAVESSADDEDRQVQADLLSFMLRRHPALTSLSEIERELAERSYGPYARDAVERGVRDLVHAGLLHRLGDFVFATLAAVHQHTLPQ